MPILRFERLPEGMIEVFEAQVSLSADVPFEIIGRSHAALR